MVGSRFVSRLVGSRVGGWLVGSRVVSRLVGSKVGGWLVGSRVVSRLVGRRVGGWLVVCSLVASRVFQGEPVGRGPEGKHFQEKKRQDRASCWRIKAPDSRL